jgi:hypothetical protein
LLDQRLPTNTLWALAASLSWSRWPLAAGAVSAEVAGERSCLRSLFSGRLPEAIVERP